MREKPVRGWRRRCASAVAALTVIGAIGAPTTSHALRFDLDYFGGITGTLNTNISLAAQWRIQERDPGMIGKANLNPSVCRSSCQPHLSTPPDVGAQLGRNQLGLEAEGDFVNQLGLRAPGSGSLNNDDGNLNFDQGEITQAPAQITQDLTLDWKGWTFFARYNAFHDFVNYNRDQYFPTYYTKADAQRDADRHSDGIPGTPPGGEFGFPTPGTALFEELSSSYEEQLGQDIDLLDFNVSGPVGIPFTGIEGQLTVGEQIINWGESTLISVNSLNTINPINVNALFRPAFLELATVFEPVGAIKYSAPLTLNTSFEVFYQYDWDPVEIPPRGGFLSFIDITLGAGEDNNINPGFGQVTEDRQGNARAEQQLLTGIADVSGRVPVRERHGSDDGQFGLAYTWYLPSFNNGTELRFYYAQYNSRLPYFSAIAGQESCLQAMPDGLFPDGPSNDLVDLNNDCPQQDTAHTVGAITQHLSGEDAAEAAFLAERIAAGSDADRSPTPTGATGGQGYECGPNRPGTGPCAEAYVLDSFEGVLEYPEDIDVFGLSFNTSFGDIAIQGEVAYRPNLPLQVDDVDVAFTALQPSAPLGCAGENAGPDCVPGSTDDVYYFGANVGGEEVLLSDAVGRANAFPSFLESYRGLAPGDIKGSLPANPETGEPGRPGDYIQGYERFQVLQYNLGGTYVIGPGNWLRSSQIILLFEVGATHVPDLPRRSELQIEGPGTFYHASVGSDGSGAPKCPDGVIQGEAANPDSTRTEQAKTTICGPHQLRFNPTQQQDGFATDFSWGYRVIGLIRYENVLPGISFEPVFVIWHDIDGTAPGPGENFIEGREIYVLNVEMRYRQNWSVVAGVTVFRGAKPYNLLADRDFFQLGVRYRF